MKTVSNFKATIIQLCGWMLAGEHGTGRSVPMCMWNYR